MTSLTVRKALIPISLGNDRFSSANLIPALEAIGQPYDELTFIIANNIQVYNRVRRIHDANRLASTLTEFENGKALFEERRQWLVKVKEKVSHSIASANWRILSFDDLVECGVYQVFRNVLVTYAAIDLFRAGIDAAAVAYLGGKGGGASDERDIRLSKAYILEEVAASITLHVVCDIQNEYYLGTHLALILELYAGRYGIDVFSLANVSPRSETWNFFSYDVPGGAWLQERCPFEA